MAQLETVERGWLPDAGRKVAIGLGIVLLPPFIMLALVPMMLFLLPVAIVGIPSMIVAFMSGSLATRAESRRMLSLRPRLSIVR
jgi:hypothetical protein